MRSYKFLFWFTAVCWIAMTVCFIDARRTAGKWKALAEQRLEKFNELDARLAKLESN